MRILFEDGSQVVLKEDVIEFTQFNDTYFGSFYLLSDPSFYTNTPGWTLGTPFLTYFCVAFDYQRLEMGIGQTDLLN